MKTLINHSTDPHYNLAMEEYLLKNVDLNDDLIFLWQNEPSIIIGRNQNTIEEINLEYVEKYNIHVVRRTSGGGAVYHDLGNINYTFMTKSLKDNLNNYRKFTEPVIKALRHFGVPAEFSGRNDIVVEGKKISGNAQSYYKNKMFHHGTILFDSDLDRVNKVLTVKKEKIESKGIKSIRSRVTNIRPYLKQDMDVKTFMDELLKFILDTDDITPHIITLSEEDLRQIQKLRDEKYMTWEWNFGESPAFTIQKTGKYAGGMIDVRFNVENGRIVDCKFYGDFFGREPIDGLIKDLIGLPFTKEAIQAKLDEVPLEDYMYNITREDLINCIFG
ncbi:MAG TPA: lipoate--protein ligase [Haloplasmataceae bacterium]